MTSIHEATPSQLEAHEAHKARVDRLFGRRPKPVEAKHVDNNLPEPDPQVVSDLRAEVEKWKAKYNDLRASLPQDHEPCTGPSPAVIKALVAKTYGVTVNGMESMRRFEAIIRPRQIAIHLMLNLSRRTLAQVGRHFSNRDHSTILHSNRLIADMRRDNLAFNAELSALERKLTGGL